jgi:hypothetical protein
MATMNWVNAKVRQIMASAKRQAVMYLIESVLAARAGLLTPKPRKKRRARRVVARFVRPKRKCVKPRIKKVQVRATAISERDQALKQRRQDFRTKRAAGIVEHPPRTQQQQFVVEHRILPPRTSR